MSRKKYESLCKERNVTALPANAEWLWHFDELKHKEQRGGKREGSGRPKLKESEKKKTKVMRIPLSKVKAVLKLLQQ